MKLKIIHRPNPEGSMYAPVAEVVNAETGERLSGVQKVTVHFSEPRAVAVLEILDFEVETVNTLPVS